MGFLDALALAGRGQTAYQQGQREQQRFADALRQKEDATAIEADYKRAQSNEANARAFSLRNPAPKARDIDPLSPEGLASTTYLEQLRAKLRPEAKEPRDSYTATSGTDENGNPIIVVLNSRTGEVHRTPIGKPATAGGAGGSVAPVGDMEARLAEIEQHARNLATKKTKISRTMQMREGIGYGIANSSAEGKGVPLGQAGAAMGMDLFGLGEGKDYEQFQALMNSTRAFGDDAAKVFKGRQNEQAVAREIALSQLSPDDYQNPQVVEQKLSRMRHVVELARQTMPHGDEKIGGAQPPQGGTRIVVNGKPFVIPE